MMAAIVVNTTYMYVRYSKRSGLCLTLQIKRKKMSSFVVDSLRDSQNCRILDKRLDGTNIISFYLAEHMELPTT